MLTLHSTHRSLHRGANLSRAETAGIILFLALMSPALSADYRYTIVDLGSLTPQFVNDHGTIAGTISFAADGYGYVEPHAVLYVKGTITSLAPNAFSSQTTGLNHLDQVSGTTGSLGPGTSGFFYSNGQLATISGAEPRLTETHGVNDAGHIPVENGYHGTGYATYLYYDGALHPLPIPSAQSLNGINNHDEVIGTQYAVQSILHGFIYANGVLTDIGSLGGDCTPANINDRTEVVGFSNTADGGQHAFRYSNGLMTDLGVLPGYPVSHAAQINNAGQIVGTVYVGTGYSTGRAFYFENGTITDLSALVDLSNATFSDLLTAVSISDSGYIVGIGGLKAGGMHGYLLIPIRSTGPGWWTTRGVIDLNRPAADYAAVNQGQVKNFAKKAYDELQARLSGGAGTALTALISGWSDTSTAKDYAAVNQGQLKSIAKLFYDRLAETGYHGTPLSGSQTYPWTSSMLDDADYAAANIGQAKYLFSFDPGSTP